MISLARVSASAGFRNRVRLTNVTAELTTGAFAFVAPPEHGGPLLLAVLAGVASARGDVHVLGDAPRLRPEVAWVPLANEHLANLSVREVLALGARFRGGEKDFAARLEPFGLASTLDRRLATLDRAALHTVSLAIAITSDAKVMLLEEPLARVDARAAAPLVDAIRARAERGACIVIATASDRDAHALGAKVFHPDAEGWHQARSAQQALSTVRAFRIGGAELRPLATAIAADERAAGVSWQGTDLIAFGDDPNALAGAVTEHVAATGVAVDFMVPLAEVPA